MATPHDRLHAALAGGSSTPPTWGQLRALLHAVSSEPSPESVALLRKVAQHEGTLEVSPAGGLPHAMAPEEMARFVAVQALGEWDAQSHREVLVRAAELSDSDHVIGAVRRLTDG